MLYCVIFTLMYELTSPLVISPNIAFPPISFNPRSPPYICPPISPFCAVVSRARVGAGPSPPPGGVF